MFSSAPNNHDRDLMMQSIVCGCMGCCVFLWSKERRCELCHWQQLPHVEITDEHVPWQFWIYCCTGSVCNSMQTGPDLHGWSRLVMYGVQAVVVGSSEPGWERIACLRALHNVAVPECAKGVLTPHSRTSHVVRHQVSMQHLTGQHTERPATSTSLDQTADMMRHHSIEATRPSTRGNALICLHMCRDCRLEA